MKKNKRRQQSSQFVMKMEYVGILLFVLAIFAFFSWGFIGVFVTNILRLFVGDVFRLFSILLALYGLFLAVKRKIVLPLSLRQHVSLVLSIVIVLILFELIGFSDKNNLLQQTWQALSSDLFSNTVLRTAGGGLIGALFTNIFIFLFGEIGTYLILVLLSVFVAGVLSGKTFSDVTTMLANMNWKVKKPDKVKHSSLQQIREKVTALFPDEEEQDVQNANNTDVLQSKEPVYQEISEEKTMVINTFEPEPSLEDVQETKDVSFDMHENNEHYVLPPVSLLKKVEAVDQSSEHALIKRNRRILEETFKSFGVNARVISANLGPSVTKFEVQPAVGVKVSKIVGLADDLALALAAKDIRIEAPIPGKSFIGIEVPNQTTSMVSFREIIEGNIQSVSKLEVPLGRDISGNIRVADLSKMPHLLVAGATGSGKSVAINGMITSILMKAKPSEVKLMMIDPKKVELNVYNGIPHLLTPVVTNPKRASQALQKVVLEMERRYELFAQTGMRNITGYNEQVDEFNETADEPMQKMPYIVVIVDELADLMMVASNEVESAIIRLAQMARAAGIHMVLATQRPSVDVITGLIKANVPSRMAFAVSSSIDSRTIIDSNGAEKLLGKGDMLFQPMGENKPIRIQGAYLSDSEVEQIVAFVKSQQEANYVEDMMPSDEESMNQGESEDELFGDVVDFVKTQEFVSVSMLQRRFRIGFNRAARLMDDLEIKGYVGAAEGSKPRRVLITE